MKLSTKKLAAKLCCSTSFLSSCARKGMPHTRGAGKKSYLFFDLREACEWAVQNFKKEYSRQKAEAVLEESKLKEKLKSDNAKSRECRVTIPAKEPTELFRDLLSEHVKSEVSASFKLERIKDLVLEIIRVIEA